MAKNLNITTVKLTLNGKEVEWSLQRIRKEAEQTALKMKGMTAGSAEWKKEFKNLEKLHKAEQDLIPVMQKVNHYMQELGKTATTDIGKAIRELTKMRDAMPGDHKSLSKINGIIKKLSEVQKTNKGMQMSFTEAQKQLQNLGNVKMDKLKQGLESIKAMLDNPNIGNKWRRQLEQMAAQYNAAIATRQTPITNRPVAQMNAQQLGAERTALMSAIAATSGVKGYEGQTSQYEQRLKAINQQLTILSEKEKKAAADAKQLTATQEAAKTVQAVYKGQEVSLENLDAAYKTLEARANKFAGVNPAKAKVAQQQMAAIAAKIKEVKASMQEEIKIDKQFLRTATTGQLQTALQQLQQKLQGLNSTQSKAARKIKEDMAAVQKQIESNTKAVSAQGSAFKTTLKNLTAYVGVFAMFNKLKTMVEGVIKKNMEMSDQLANIRKVSGLAMSDINELNKRLAKIDTRSSIQELNQLAYTGSKLGFGEMGIDALEGFVRSALKVQNALKEDMGEDAMTALSKMVEVMGLIPKMGVEKAMDATGSAIFKLASTSTATGSNIVEFSKRLMGLANQAGITADELLAFGSAADAMALMPEVAATAFNKLITAVQKQPNLIENALHIDKGTISDMFQAGKMADAMVLIFEKMREKGGMNALMHSGVFKDLGSDGARLVGVMATMANRVDILNKHMETSRKAFKDATAVEQEYAIQMETAEAYMERASNMWTKAFVNPEGIDNVKSFAEAWYEVSKSLTENKVVMGELQFLLTGLMGALKMLLSLLPGLLYAFGTRGIIWMFTALGSALGAGTIAANGFRVAWQGMSLAMKANWISLAIGLVVQLTVYLVSASDKLKELLGIETEAEKKMAEITKGYAAAHSASEQASKGIEHYKKALDDANLSQDQRNRLIDKFKNEYGVYLSYLRKEIKTVDDLRDAYADVVRVMQQKKLFEEKEKLKESLTGERKTENRKVGVQIDEELKKLGINTDEYNFGNIQKISGYGAERIYTSIMERYFGKNEGKDIEHWVSNGTNRRSYNSRDGRKLLELIKKYTESDQSIRADENEVEKMFAHDLKGYNNDEFEQSKFKSHVTDYNALEDAPDKAAAAAARKAQQDEKQAIRKELQDAKQESDAIIAKIEEWYRLQETVVTGFAADGKWTQQQAEMVNRELEAAKNEALANARLAISGRDTQTWEQTKESLRVMMFDTGEWSQELFQQMMDVSMASIRQNLANIDAGGGKYGITTSSLKDGLDKNAAGNRRKVQELRNKTAKEVEKMLKQYDYLQLAMDALDDRLSQLGLLTDSAVAAANRIREATENPNESLKAGYQGPPTAEQYQQRRRMGLETAATRFIAAGGKSMAVNYNDSQELGEWLRELTNATVSMGANGMEFKFDSWADAFKEDFDRWLHDSQKYKSEIKAFYLSLIQASDDYTDATKKAYEREKKLQDQRFQLAGYKTAEERTDTSLELQGKMQSAMGSGQNFWQQNGMADTMKNDPEILRIQNRIYYRNMEYEDAKAHLDRMLALQQEELQAAKDSGASEQQLAEMQEQQRQARAGIEELTYQRQTELLTATADLAAKVSQEIASRVSTIQELSQPIADFAENAGQKLGDMMFNMQSQSMTWNQIWKNMVLALAQSTVKMGAQWLTQKIQQALFYKQMEADETLHQALMTTIALGGATARMEGEAAINSTRLATNSAINAAEVGEEVSLATILTMLGISKGAAKIIGTLGWWGIPLVAVISSLLLGLLASALSTAGQESSASSAAKPKVKLASGMLTYDEGNVQTVVGDDGRVYRAREQRSLPEGVSMVTEPIATRVNGQQALVGERGPEIVIGRRTTRAIQMNRPDLLRDLALIDRGITTRKVRTFDEGNISDLASAIRPTDASTESAASDGSQTIDAATAEALRQMPAAMAAFAQVMTVIQKQGIPAKIQKYGTGGLIDEVQSGLKFVSKYK